MSFFLFTLPYVIIVSELSTVPCCALLHYNDVIMSVITSQINSLAILFTQSFIQAQIKENIKAPRHWPLWGEFTGDRWIHRTKGQ